MATSKSAGSTSKNRSSLPKYRGVKKFGGESVIPGNIILRQKAKVLPGKNTIMGRDFTIQATASGIVKFYSGYKGRTYITVIPHSQVA